MDNKVDIKIHCKTSDGWIVELLRQADRIDTLRKEGKDIEIKIIVDGTRGTVFKFNKNAKT